MIRINYKYFAAAAVLIPLSTFCMESPEPVRRENYEQIIRDTLTYNPEDLENEDPSGNTILHRISESDQGQLFALLQERASEILKKLAVKKNSQGRTPLHIAATYGNLAFAELLLKIDREHLNEQDKKGQTPLYMAAAFNREAVVKLLVSKGANICLKADDGASPALLAIGIGSPLEVVQLLIERNGRIVCEGGNINARLWGGNTLLHAAARADSVENVKYLLDKGADRAVTNDTNETPLDLAEERVAELQATIAGRIGIPLEHQQETIEELRKSTAIAEVLRNP